MHKYESNASMLSSVIFYLKSVHLLFLFSVVLFIKRHILFTWERDFGYIYFAVIQS